jgi:hypothetical protein
MSRARLPGSRTSLATFPASFAAWIFAGLGGT